MADVNTVDIRDVNLFCPDLNAFHILKLTECFPLPHVLFHILDVFVEQQVQITVLTLLHFHLFHLGVDLTAFLLLLYQLFI